MHVPLSAIKYAELLLRFPRNHELRDVLTVRGRYNEVRRFVRSTAPRHVFPLLDKQLSDDTVVELTVNKQLYLLQPEN